MFSNHVKRVSCLVKLLPELFAAGRPLLRESSAIFSFSEQVIIRDSKESTSYINETQKFTFQTLLLCYIANMVIFLSKHPHIFKVLMFTGFISMVPFFKILSNHFCNLCQSSMSHGVNARIQFLPEIYFSAKFKCSFYSEAAFESC